MGGDSGISIFIGALLLFLYFIAGQKKKEPVLPAPRVIKPGVKPTQIKPAKVQSKPLDRTPILKKETKVKRSPLHKGWNKKSSLRQAFILSEIFKRYDEP